MKKHATLELGGVRRFAAAMCPSSVCRRNGDAALGEADTERPISGRHRIATCRSDGSFTADVDAATPNQEDAVLLQAWRNGKSDAGKSLIERHRPALLGFLRRHAGDLAEDLLQETLMVGISHRDTFRGDSSFRTYLFGIAKNLLRRARQRRRHLPEIQPLGDVEAVGLDVESDPDPDVAPLILSAVKRLRRPEQLMVQNYFWDELTGAEIARKFGISERTVRSRLHRVLARLRAVLVEMDDESP
ncbi:MAG: sigma-70 family RNA polymerase sigma factor [Polyangiaceae bacterium]